MKNAILTFCLPNFQINWSIFAVATRYGACRKPSPAGLHSTETIQIKYAQYKENNAPGGDSSHRNRSFGTAVCRLCRGFLQSGKPLRHQSRRRQERLRVSPDGFLPLERTQIHPQTSQHGARSCRHGHRQAARCGLRHNWHERGGECQGAHRPHR